ncbi:MAG: DNA-methyltransferase [Lachnospiraceae bacterium]
MKEGKNTQTDQKGIQLTLLDYFRDADCFTLSEARECIKQEKEVKEPSIRARIYEGIDKGMFRRLKKGVYTVTRQNEDQEQVTCMLIQGDGRDLSFLMDNSVDAIITDHPYNLKSSLKGGNRDFADYDCFQYMQIDMDEKYRVLKKGHFLVEFLPEENGENYQYLYQIKEMAKESGLEYYAKVAWKKGDFVANTGRKSKNTEEIVFFSKGKARSLRPDAKKNKEEPGISHVMSGAKGMLPTVFDVAPLAKHNRIHQAEKPVELLRQLIEFVTEKKEWVLDQFSGSFALGEAAMESGRNSICIEISEEYFAEGKVRMKAVQEKNQLK